MSTDNRNQSLQEFDERFDQMQEAANNNDDNLIDDDMMNDAGLEDLGDGLMAAEDDAGDEQLNDIDDMDFGDNNEQIDNRQPPKKRLQDIEFDRDSDQEDIDEDLFNDVQ